MPSTLCMCSETVIITKVRITIVNVLYRTRVVANTQLPSSSRDRWKRGEERFLVCFPFNFTVRETHHLLCSSIFLVVAIVLFFKEKCRIFTSFIK